MPGGLGPAAVPGIPAAHSKGHGQDAPAKRGETGEDEQAQQPAPGAREAAAGGREIGNHGRP